MEDASWKEKIKGGLDLIFMFGRGIAPFEKGGRRAALQSLWILAFFFPFGVLATYLHPPADLKTEPMSTVMTITIASEIIGIPVGLGLLWLFAKATKTLDRFWIPFQAGNWLAIPWNLLTLPFLILAFTDFYPREKIDHILIALSYYNMVFIGGCVVYRGLKVGWEWAGFFVCMNVVVGQMIWNLLFWLNGVPIKWDF